MSLLDLFKRKTGEKASSTTQNARMWRRQALVAVVLRACQKCGAPARFLSDPSVQSNHPGNYVPQGHAWEDMTFDDACRTCGCPGRYTANVMDEVRFPEIFVDKKDRKFGKHVGKTCPHCKSARPGPECPNCGELRPENEDKGEVWIKEYN